MAVDNEDVDHLRIDIRQVTDRQIDHGERLRVVEVGQISVLNRLSEGASAMQGLRTSISDLETSTRKGFVDVHEAYRKKPIKPGKIATLLVAIGGTIVALVTWFARQPTAEDVNKIRDTVRTVEIEQAKGKAQIDSFARDLGWKLDTVIQALPKKEK